MLPDPTVGDLMFVVLLILIVLGFAVKIWFGRTDNKIQKELDALDRLEKGRDAMRRF
jgi:hypothetical protein